jgi:hypothetical protein
MPGLQMTKDPIQVGHPWHHSIPLNQGNTWHDAIGALSLEIFHHQKQPLLRYAPETDYRFQISGYTAKLQKDTIVLPRAH